MTFTYQRAKLNGLWEGSQSQKVYGLDNLIISALGPFALRWNVHFWPDSITWFTNRWTPYFSPNVLNIHQMGPMWRRRIWWFIGQSRRWYFWFRVRFGNCWRFLWWHHQHNWWRFRHRCFGNRDWRGSCQCTGNEIKMAFSCNGQFFVHMTIFIFRLKLILLLKAVTLKISKKSLELT